MRHMQITFLGLILLLAAVVGLASATKAETPGQSPLPQLAANRFGKLSLAEDKLVNAAVTGEIADCSALSGDDRVIRGDLLSWLCTNPRATPQLTYRGISITGARIVNECNLEWARISFPIRLLECVFLDAIILSRSDIAFLDLSGSSVQELQASGTHSKGDLILSNDFKAQGEVNLSDAKIDGSLVCDGSRFTSKDNGPALAANGAEVKGGVFLNKSNVQGQINFGHAKIDENLECDGGQFTGKGDTPALDANNVEVKSSVFLSKSNVQGQVNFGQAKIDGSLVCDGGQFISKDKRPALEANGAEVKGGVFLRNGFEADGRVDLIRAKIGVELGCDGGQFISKDKRPALDANGAEVKGGVFLRNGFEAEGGVGLTGATIDGNLEADGGQFISKGDPPALYADDAKIEGDVYFRGLFSVEGEVTFVGAYVGRNFQWSDLKSPEKLVLDLRHAKVGTLFNPQNSWPTQGRLRVDGFVYDQFDRAAPDAKAQLPWLRLQPNDRFLSQPFEQLAGVLRKMGLEEDARAVMIAKNEEHAHYVERSPEWLWYGLFGQLIGYGYSPWRAFGISLIIILIGWAAFRRGYCRGLITPTGETEYTMENDEAHPVSKDYPKFNAFVYSLETFVPLVKLGIADHWEPNGNRDAFFVENSPLMTGGWLRGYMWFHIIAGWVLTALWVGGITGLVKT